MGTRRQKFLLRGASLFVLLAALLPGIAYMGHWSAGASGHVHPGEAQTSTNHEDHCHVGPAKCSGGVSTVGTWWVEEEPFSIEPDTIPNAIQTEDVAGSSREATAPILQPPQYA